MDWVLARFSFAKCYIDDIIIFSPTLEDQRHHMQEVFERLKDHNHKFHRQVPVFLDTSGILGSYGLSRWIGGYKRPRLKPFHRCRS
jgi:hypothetical protein